MHVTRHILIYPPSLWHRDLAAFDCRCAQISVRNRKQASESEQRVGHEPNLEALFTCPFLDGGFRDRTFLKSAQFFGLEFSTK